MAEEICPHCEDWKGELQKFVHEWELVFTGCPRCVDAELAKSKLGPVFKARYEDANDLFEGAIKSAKAIRDKLKKDIEHLQTELDIRVLNPDWKSIHVEVVVAPGGVAELHPQPVFVPFFLPKAARIKSVAPLRVGPGRFKLRDIRVDGCSQEHDLVASDFEKPRRVNWSVIGCSGLGRIMQVGIESEDDVEIVVQMTIWGEPYSDDGLGGFGGVAGR